MGSLLLRLRHALIHALGGYTRQQQILQRPIQYRSTPVQISRFVAEAVLDADCLSRERAIDYVKHTKDMLTRELVEKLRDAGLVRLEAVDASYRNQVCFRAMLYVVPPEPVVLHDIFKESDDT